MNEQIRRARAILDSAAMLPPDQRYLRAAAAISVLAGPTRRPVVVGGTAQVYWVRHGYHPTDLDLCVSVDPELERLLVAAGLVRDGRHWWDEAAGVAIEFPETVLDGSPERIREVLVEGVDVAVIGVEDLYIDRVRQSTAYPGEGESFNSAVAIASANYEVIDWDYVRGRVRSEAGALGESMRRIDRRVRTRARRAVLAAGE